MTTRILDDSKGGLGAGLWQPATHVWDFQMWFHVGDTLRSISSPTLVLTPVLIYDVLMGPSVCPLNSLLEPRKDGGGGRGGWVLVFHALSWLGAGSSLSRPQV